MTYWCLLVHFPQLRPASLVSTLHRVSQILRGGLLVKRAPPPLNYCLHWIFKVQHTHACTNFTICFLVLSFELLRSEVAEAVVIKWVPRRLCRAGAVRSRNSGFCLALVLDSIISIKLNRLDDDWLRCKRSRETMKVL